MRLVGLNVCCTNVDCLQRNEALILANIFSPESDLQVLASDATRDAILPYVKIFQTLLRYALLSGTQILGL